jgi:hypothetical protein
VEARGEVADRPSAMSLADHRGCTCRAFACFSKRCCPPLLPRGSVMRPLFRVLPVLPLPSLPFAVWMPTLDATVVFPSFSTPPSAPHPMSIRLAEASGGGAPQPPPLSQPLRFLNRRGAKQGPGLDPRCRSQAPPFHIEHL